MLATNICACEFDRKHTMSIFIRTLFDLHINMCAVLLIVICCCENESIECLTHSKSKRKTIYSKGNQSKLALQRMVYIFKCSACWQSNATATITTELRITLFGIQLCSFVRSFVSLFFIVIFFVHILYSFSTIYF